MVELNAALSRQEWENKNKYSSRWESNPQLLCLQSDAMPCIDYPTALIALRIRKFILNLNIHYFLVSNKKVSVLDGLIIN